MSDDEEEYQVGYGRPPKASQWGPGQSGNVAGRPRKRSHGGRELPFHRLILEEAYRPVKVLEDGKMVERPAFQVSCRATLVGGINGRAQSHKLSAELIAAAEAATTQEVAIDAARLSHARDMHQQRLSHYFRMWRQKENNAYYFMARLEQEAWDMINNAMPVKDQKELVGRLTGVELDVVDLRSSSH